MRMAHIVTEVSGFSTYCTFCHDVAPPRTLLDSHYIVNPQQSYSSRWRRIMQGKIKKIIKKSLQIYYFAMVLFIKTIKNTNYFCLLGFMGKEIAHKLQIFIPPSVRRIVGKDNDAWENRQTK